MTIAILVIDTNDNNKTAYNQGPLTAATVCMYVLDIFFLKDILDRLFQFGSHNSLILFLFFLSIQTREKFRKAIANQLQLFLFFLFFLLTKRVSNNILTLSGD